MSTVLENKPASRGGVADKLAFFNGLQSATNAIHSTTHLDEIILDLGGDICSLFGADRLTIYVGCDGGKSIVRVGLHEFLVGTDAIKKNIQEHARVADMFATAVEEGMRTLKQDGVEKILMGVTDIHQVRSVCIK